MKIILLTTCLTLCSCHLIPSLIPTGKPSIRATIGKNVTNHDGLFTNTKQTNYKGSTVHYHGGQCRWSILASIVSTLAIIIIGFLAGLLIWLRFDYKRKHNH